MYIFNFCFYISFTSSLRSHLLTTLYVGKQVRTYYMKRLKNSKSQQKKQMMGEKCYIWNLKILTIIQNQLARMIPNFKSNHFKPLSSQLIIPQTDLCLCSSNTVSFLPFLDEPVLYLLTHFALQLADKYHFFVNRLANFLLK